MFNIVRKLVVFIKGEKALKKMTVGHCLEAKASLITKGAGGNGHDSRTNQVRDNSYW